MLSAMLNRAAMRVADTTEVSGRVTADSREKQTMKPTIRTWLALVTVSLGLYLGLSVCGLANDQGQNNQGQCDAGINGTYSVHITGYVPDSSGNMVPLAVAGRVTHFTNGTNGTESGVATASVNGQLQTTTFTGTLTINPDGVSWSEIVTQTSPPFLTLHYILYPTPDGNTINEVETDPGTTDAGVLRRGR